MTKRGALAPSQVLRTWSAQGRAHTFAIDRARGARIHVPGHGWVWDFKSQVFNVNVGHAHPRVLARMETQLAQVCCAGPNVDLPIRQELARRLLAHAGLGRAFFALGGAEAMENAVKMAMLITGRSQVLARRHAYHGASLGMLQIAGDVRREPFAGRLGSGLWIDDPYPPRAPRAGAPSDWVESLRARLEQVGPENVAAIVLEGLTGTNGVQEPPADFWPEVRRLCDAHGIVLIDDEVFSGLGRTGKMFAWQHWGVRPDMVVLGKGLACGYAPLSAVLVREELAAHFDDATLSCGLTGYASPIGCAAAAGCLDAIEEEDLVARAARAGLRLRERLGRLGQATPAIRDVRGRGLLLGVQLDRAAAPVAAAMWDAHVLVASRDDLLFLCPPLTIEDEGLEAAAQALSRALEATT